MEILIQWVTEYGYAAIFFLLVLGLAGLPIPDEVLLAFVGFLVFQGILQPIPSVIVAFSGSVCGITISFCVGRLIGTTLTSKYGKWISVTPKKLERVHQWFESYGKWTLFFGYFIPGFRHLTAMVAGGSKLEYPLFALFAYPGALIWSTLYVFMGYSLGHEWEKVSGMIRNYTWVAALVAILFLSLYLLVRGLYSRPRRY